MTTPLEQLQAKLVRRREAEALRPYAMAEARRRLPRLQGRPAWPKHGRSRARREAARQRARSG